MTLSIMVEYCYAECHLCRESCVECCYAESHCAESQGVSVLVIYNCKGFYGLFQCFWVSPDPSPSEAPLRCSTLWSAPDLTHKHCNRLEKPSWNKHSILLAQFVSYEENEVLQGTVLYSVYCTQVLYLQHFIFIEAYEEAQYVRVFVTYKPFLPGFTKHSSLLCQFVSYKENTLGTYSQHFIFFVSYKKPNKLECLSPWCFSGNLWFNTKAIL